MTQGGRTSLEIGTTFAGYRIEEPAGGQRGIGRVYVATHLESERQLEFPPWPVALKVFLPPKSHDAAFRRRFEEVARRQTGLNHPNLVSIYEVGTSPAPFISMTLFHGPNLADLTASRELDDASILAVVESVAAALEAGHASRLVYRRLCLSSVLVASDGERAFLADFGAGRSAKSTELMEGEELGTFIDYISPEDVRGEDVGPRSNVYSLAAIAFECLTGEPPFPRQEGPQALQARLEEDPRPLGMLRPELPAGLEFAFKRALDPEPRRRQGSPAEFAKALRRAYPKQARGSRRADAAAEIVGLPAVAATPPLRSAKRRRRRMRRAVTAPAAASTRAETQVVAAPEEARPAGREDGGTPARGKRRLVPALLLVALLLVGAGVLGAVAAPSDDADPRATQAKRLSSGSLALRHPADWTRAREVPSVPGLELLDPVALAAGGASGRGGVLVAGHVEPDGDEPLPSALLERLPSPPEREAVDLGAVQAYRYSRLRPRGFDREATLYVVPTSGAAAVVVGCLAPVPAGAFAAHCERVASTLELSGETAVALAPSPAYARGLQRVLGRLNAARRSERGRVGTDRTPAGQARNAVRLSLVYRSARRGAARLTPPPVARRAHEEIVRSLARVTGDYRGLAAAARSRSGSRWSSAAAAVGSSEGRLQASLGALRPLGYDPRRP